MRLSDVKTLQNYFFQLTLKMKLSNLQKIKKKKPEKNGKKKLPENKITLKNEKAEKFCKKNLTLKKIIKKNYLQKNYSRKKKICREIKYVIFSLHNF